MRKLAAPCLIKEWMAKINQKQRCPPIALHFLYCHRHDNADGATWKIWSKWWRFTWGLHHWCEYLRQYRMRNKLAFSEHETWGVVCCSLCSCIVFIVATDQQLPSLCWVTLWCVVVGGNAANRAGLIYKATLAYLQSHLQKKAPRIPTCKTYQAVTSRTSTCKFISAYFSLQELPGTLISKYSCHTRLIQEQTAQRSSSSHSYVQPKITSNLSTDENEAANATKPRNLISFSPQLALLLSSHLSLQPDQVYHRDGGIRPWRNYLDLPLWWTCQ